MDTKKNQTTTKKITTTAPLVKARSVSSLKSRGDISSEVLWKTSTVTKNSSTGLRGSSGTPTYLSSKSATKDIRFRSQANLNEVNGDSILEEAKLDIIDDAYNSYTTLKAMTALSAKSKTKVRGDIDKQISTLQQRVNDNLDVLEKTRSKLDSLYLIQEQSNLLAQHSDACSSYAREPAFTQGKSFEDLMAEIDRIKNQLPCNQVSIPKTPTDLDKVRNATSQLIQSLEIISTTYGADQVPISDTILKLDKIKSTRDEVLANKLSVENVSLKASTTIVNEGMLKTPTVKPSKENFGNTTG